MTELLRVGKLACSFFCADFFGKMRSEKLRIFTISFFRSPYLRISKSVLSPYLNSCYLFANQQVIY